MNRRENLSSVRGLSVAELEQKKNGYEKDLFDLRQKKVTGQLDKPHQFKALKKQIARIETVKREKKDVR